MLKVSLEYLAAGQKRIICFSYFLSRLTLALVQGQWPDHLDQGFFICHATCKIPKVLPY